MAGRRPVPTALRLVRGNPGKRKIPKHEPRPRVVNPAPPKGLRKDAAAQWRKLAPILARLRVLTEADLAALELTCNAWADYAEAAAFVKAEGAWYRTTTDTGGELVRANPALTERADAWRRFRLGLVEFGLTPASRSKVAALPAEEADPLAEFLEGASS
ncbi:MAG: Phage terminase, small subunit [Acidobacteria bacterium ADurb.Bin051]|nr:MAG: Phage terminase, small subunit [Acidobacteria bacterium ADurb.Bin051]